MDRSDWLQAAGNVGILLGLVIVALQMKQNSDLLGAQLVYEESDRVISTQVAAMGENPASVWAKALDDPQSLNLEEQVVVEAYIFTAVERWRALYRLTERGLFDQEWESILKS